MCQLLQAAGYEPDQAEPLLDARRSAEEYWAKWLTATALQPDVAQLARGSLALEGAGKREAKRKPRQS